MVWHIGSQTCEGQVPVEMEVCPFCIIELACCCELRNSNIYIPPSLSNCAEASSRTLVTQTPNLPYISSFYKRPNNSLLHLYRESYNMRDLPSFTISVAEWDTFAAADREMSSDMGKIVKMLNNDSQIGKEHRVSKTSIYGIFCPGSACKGNCH